MNRPDVLNEETVRSLPDTGPVTMLNMLRFRAVSVDGNGSGWDAYLRYSQLTAPLIKARGGTVLWAGNVEGAAFGDPGTRWDYVVLVMYPSRAAFLDMVTSQDYARANVHREAGVEEHLILATGETYSKFKRG
jgi:uncharacterized protein (DUF1330 family)